MLNGFVMTFVSLFVAKLDSIIKNAFFGMCATKTERILETYNELKKNKHPLKGHFGIFCVDFFSCLLMFFKE